MKTLTQEKKQGYTLMYTDGTGQRVDPDYFKQLAKNTTIFQVDECGYKSRNGYVMVWNECNVPKAQLCSVYPITEEVRGELEKELLSIIPETTIIHLGDWFKQFGPRIPTR